jgi:hypothetical protein
MTWSATELHIAVCCYLVEGQKWEAAMLLRPCVLDYENKNDTAYITITAPPTVIKASNSSTVQWIWIYGSRLRS